jgi:hypothetical protein
VWLNSNTCSKISSDADKDCSLEGRLGQRSLCKRPSSHVLLSLQCHIIWYARRKKAKNPENGFAATCKLSVFAPTLGRLRETLDAFEKGHSRCSRPDQGLLLCFTSLNPLLLLSIVLTHPSYVFTSPHQLISPLPSSTILEALNVIPTPINTSDWGQALSVIAPAPGERTIENPTEPILRLTSSTVSITYFLGKKDILNHLSSSPPSNS